MPETKNYFTQRKDYPPSMSRCDWDFPYIDRVGIELEGAWSHGTDITWDLKGDTSLNFGRDRQITEDNCEYEFYKDLKGQQWSEVIRSVGEACSSPLQPFSVYRFMRKCYPDITNKTAGIHVHFSVKPSFIYSFLLDENFYNDWFLHDMERWGKSREVKSTQFWSRMNGENHYCARRFDCNSQFRGSGDRYTQLNYDAYRKFHTLECRLLPTFQDVELAIDAVRAVLKTANDWLSYIVEDNSKLIVEPFEVAPDDETEDILEAKELVAAYEPELISVADYRLEDIPQLNPQGVDLFEITAGTPSPLTYQFDSTTGMYVYVSDTSGFEV